MIGTLISSQEFQTEFDRELTGLRAFIADTKPTELPRRVVVVGKTVDGPLERRLFEISSSWADEPQKHASIQALGAICCQQQFVPFAAFLTSEAWISMPRPGNAYLAPSRDPARKEVVVVGALSIDGKERAAFTEIHRMDGRIMLLSPFQTMDSHNYLLRNFYEGYAKAVVRR